MTAPPTSASSQLVNFFQATHSGFLGWQNPPASAYTFTLPPSGNLWSNLFGSPQQNAALMIVNLLFNGIASGLHLAIFLASYLATPTWILNPLTRVVDHIVQEGYRRILVAVLPLLLLILIGFAVYLFVQGRRAHMVRTLASFVIAIAAVFFIFANFAPILTFVDNTSVVATNDVGAGIETAANSHATSEYDALWTTYIVHPYELTQFGTEGPVSDFQVSNWYAGGKTYGKITVQPGGNWVTLFLENPQPSARSDLINALYAPLSNHASPFASGISTNALKNADPALGSATFFIELLLAALPIAFLGIMGVILFVQAALFILYALFAIVVLPAAVLPDYGLRLTVKWLREAVGVLLHRLLNVVYMALIFVIVDVVSQIHTTNPSSAMAGLEAGFVANAALFVLAIIARPKFIGMFSGIPFIDRRDWKGRRLPSRSSSPSPGGGDSRANSPHWDGTQDGTEPASRRKTLFQRAAGLASAKSKGSTGTSSATSDSAPIPSGTGAAGVVGAMAGAAAVGATVGSRWSTQPSSRFSSEAPSASLKADPSPAPSHLHESAQASVRPTRTVLRSGKSSALSPGGKTGGKYAFVRYEKPSPSKPASPSSETKSESEDRPSVPSGRVARTKVAIWRGGEEYSRYRLPSPATGQPPVQEEAPAKAPVPQSPSVPQAPETSSVRIRPERRGTGRPRVERRALSPSVRMAIPEKDHEAHRTEEPSGREGAVRRIQPVRVANREKDRATPASAEPTESTHVPSSSRPEPPLAEVEPNRPAVQTVRDGVWVWRTDGNYARAVRDENPNGAQEPQSDMEEPSEDVH